MSFKAYLSQEHVKNVLAGMGAGITSRFVSYPLDTIKVRLQTQPISSSQPQVFGGTFDCLKKTIEYEGISGLYKGIPTPLISSIVETTFLFSAYQQIKNRLLTSTNRKELNDKESFLAGSLTGSCLAFIVTPMELIKNRLQVQQQGKGERLYNGIIDCAVKTLKKEGFFHGIYRGFLSTVCKESIGNGFWFATYYWLTNRFIPQNGSRTDLSSLTLIFSGATAGAIYWIVPFPIDTIKNRMQVSGNSFFNTYRVIYSQQGLKGFYKGIGVTVFRALPSNAVTFLVYEKIIQLLEKV